MTRTMLRRSADREEFELRCPPEYDAQILQYFRSYAGLLDVADSGLPTKVIGSDPTLPFSYVPTFDLQQIEALGYDFLPETGHLLPLERPAECAAIVRDYLARITLG